MGMYTQLNICCLLDKAKESDIKILECMCNNDMSYQEFKDFIDDCDAYIWTFDVFHKERCVHMLQSCSEYFDEGADSTIISDDESQTHMLKVCCDLKNYNGEIESFLNYVITLTSTNGFIGYYHTEECDYPLEIHFENGVVVYKEIYGFQY